MVKQEKGNDMGRKSNIQKQKEQQNREEIKYNKLIGRQDDEFVFLDYVFRHSDGFHGATGTRMRPISKSEYEDRTDRDNLKEYYEDIWRDMVSNRKTDEGLEDWIETVIRIDGVEETAFDTSYWNSPMWDAIRKKGYPEDEYPVFECSGGGRCFDKKMKWDEVYEPELWKLIQEYEAQ